MLRADSLWRDALVLGIARLRAIAFAPAFPPVQRTRGRMARTMAAIAHARRLTARAKSALRRAEWAQSRVEVRAEMLADPERRSIVAGDLGGERALRAWETRWRTAQAAKAHAERQAATPGKDDGPVREEPATPPTPDDASRPMGEPPQRLVHPDVAWRIISRQYGTRRDWSGQFALAPIPKVEIAPTTNTTPTLQRVRPMLAVCLRTHAMTADEIRAQHVADRAQERAERLAAPDAHLDPWLHPPIRVTAQELRHGEKMNDAEVENTQMDCPAPGLSAGASRLVCATTGQATADGGPGPSPGTGDVVDNDALKTGNLTGQPSGKPP